MISAIKSRIASALAQQWPRAAAARVEVDLPLPISTNALWTVRAGRMVRTERYRSWIVSAGDMINAQRPGHIAGRYALALIISRRRTNVDLDNAVKAAGDALQAYGIIDNDRLAEQVTLKWSDTISGMRAIVEAWREEPSP